MAPNDTDPHRHAAAVDRLEAELRRTVDLATRTAPDLPIPTCPGWSATDLWVHLGTIHRWATETVRSRSTQRVSRRDLELGLPGGDDLSGWMAEGGERLVDALRDVPADAEVFTWNGENRAGWWSRRQLHETTVHDLDAALALGEDPTVDRHVAADGIDELLDNLPARLAWPGAVLPDGSFSVHLHATDGAAPDGAALDEAGEWMITVDDGGVAYTHGHAKGDVAVRGPVGELLLVAYGRVTPMEAGVEVFGDSGRLESLLATLAHG